MSSPNFSKLGYLRFHSYTQLGVFETGSSPLTCEAPLKNAQIVQPTRATFDTPPRNTVAASRAPPCRITHKIFIIVATGAPQKHGKSVDIVTFDSNVWRLVASPSKFPKDPSRPAYQKLHQACCSQTIQAFISETTFTLEQIPRKDRLAWLTSIGHTSGNTIVPHVSQGVQDHLNDAYAIGIRILKSKRIGGPASSLLNNNKYFWAYPSDTDFHKYNNKNGEIARQLEGMGLGIALLKALGPPASSSPPTHWIEGIATLAASKHINIPDLIAEWADVDALATSIAHDVTYFCTNDAGKSASGKGIVSAMSPTMSATITAQFGIHFISPDALAQKLNI